MFSGETALIVVPSGRQASASLWKPGWAVKPRSTSTSGSVPSTPAQSAGTSPVTWIHSVLHGPAPRHAGLDRLVLLRHRLGERHRLARHRPRLQGQRNGGPVDGPGQVIGREPCEAAFEQTPIVVHVNPHCSAGIV